MKAVLIYIVLFFSTISCNPSNTREEVIGRYINKYEPNAQHYIDVNEDGTFIHVYNSGENEKINKGTWLLDSSGHEVSFTTWTSFGKHNDPRCLDGCYSSVQLHYGELRFSYDEPDLNFTRE